MKRRNLIIILGGIFILITIVFFYFFFVQGSFLKENRINKEAIQKTEQQKKYKRVYDESTHILTFFVDGKKVNEVDLFDIAPISMKGRENLGLIYKTEMGQIVPSIGDTYSTIDDDKLFFNTNYEIEKIIPYIEVSDITNGFIFVNYKFYLHTKGDVFFGIFQKTFVFDINGKKIDEFSLKNDLADNINYIILSTDKDYKYISCLILINDGDNDNESIYRVISTKTKKDLLEPILDEISYIPLSSERSDFSFNEEGEIVTVLRAKDDSGRQALVKFDFDNQEAIILRIFDEKNHTLSFFDDNGEKIKDVDLFEIAPVSIEDRQKITKTSKESGDVIYSKKIGDSFRFKTFQNIDSITIDLIPLKSREGDLLSIRYNYSLYDDKGNLFLIRSFSIIFNEDGEIITNSFN